MYCICYMYTCIVTVVVLIQYILYIASTVHYNILYIASTVHYNILYIASTVHYRIELSHFKGLIVAKMTFSHLCAMHLSIAILLSSFNLE